MCQNPYQRLRMDLLEDQKVFESMMYSMGQRERIRRAEQAHRVQVEEMLVKNSVRERVSQMRIILGRMEGKIYSNKLLSFYKICCASNAHSSNTHNDLLKANRKQRDIRLQYRVLGVEIQASKQWRLERVEPASRIERGIHRLERLLGMRSMGDINDCFERLRRYGYQKVIQQQNTYIDMLKGEIEQGRSVQGEVGVEQNSMVIQLREEVKGKEKEISRLQKQVRVQKQGFQDEIEELQDEMNRLNLENIQLKGRLEPESVILGRNHAGNVTLNDSVDLSLRILDDIDFGGDKERGEQRGEIAGKEQDTIKKSTEEELSQKYFQKIVLLKELIQNASEYIEQTGSQEGSLNQQQIQQVLNLLQFQ